jgi:6,7-dimethyl-8-ribityllumazine synthase
VTVGILRVQLDNDMAVGFGVLTCNDEAQAEARAGLGGEHLDAVLQLAKVIRF